MHTLSPTLMLPIQSILLFLLCWFTPFDIAAQVETFHAADNRGYIIQVGDTIPAFQLTDLQGIEYSNTSLLGTPYVLQFTASWCGVCRKEMPHLESDVWQKFKDDSFLLLGVDLDESKETVARFAHSMEITYPIAPDPEGQLFYSIAAPKSGVTRNVVVDQNGVVVFLTRLFEAEEFNAMVRAIETLIY